jgi:hypothetical protein
MFYSAIGQYQEILQGRLDKEEIILSHRYLIETNPIFNEFWNFNKPRFTEDFVA